MSKPSPLHGEHERLGAKFSEFGGWTMPLQYGSAIEEHLTVRATAGMFDVSHLGVISVVGSDAEALIASVFSNDLGKIAPGKTQYTHVLNERGGVIDDCIVWWVSQTEFIVIPNASNTEPIESALKRGQSGFPSIQFAVRAATSRALLAIQGPQARHIVRSVLGEEASAVAPFHVRSIRMGSDTCVIGGTGYTGEDGLELLLEADSAVSVWNACLEAGAAPVGLAARDSLRLEAGLPLYGHELAEDIAPVEARLAWAIRSAVNGDPAAERLRAAVAKTGRGLVGLRSASRQFPRQGYEISFGGKEIGKITSGNYSPTLGCGIAMALIEDRVAPDAKVEVALRGRTLPMTVCALPFVPHRKRLT